MSSREPLPQVPSGHDPDGRGITPDGRLARLPALDGLRGVGQPMMMLFHHGLPLFGWIFRGSILCVSMFFTLSGFLITRILIKEHDSTERISLRRFYTRRIRRLMPTAVIVAFLIAVLWTAYPSPTKAKKSSPRPRAETGSFAASANLTCATPTDVGPRAAHRGDPGAVLPQCLGAAL